MKIIVGINFVKKLHLKISEYLELIKFEHTIFALPFALSGMLIASQDKWPDILTFVWVILAMVGGRTAAMALNRVIDADIDSNNPRTKYRAIPAGRISKFSAIILALVSFGLMIFATWQLPLICKQLLPLAILILVVYSYTKRFTNLSHLVLGTALGAGGAGGWLAVSGALDIPVILWGMLITFWVAGFDIIYAIQDIEFDRKHGLFSIPAALGIKNSLIVSRLFHIITCVSLVILGILFPIGNLYWLAVIFVFLMLVYEHSLLNENDLSRLNTAFFNVNGYISIGFMLLIVLNKLIK